MDTLVKINNIATSWMEGNYNGEDLPADLAKAAFAAMHDIYNLSKDGGWTPCSVGLPEAEPWDKEDKAPYNCTVVDFGETSVETLSYVTVDGLTAFWYDRINKLAYTIFDTAVRRVLAWQPLPELYRGEA